MFYELKGHRAQDSSELGLHKMDMVYLGSRSPCSTPLQFVSLLIFHSLLFAVGWQQQTPLSSSTITTGFLVSQLGWYPGNTYNYGSSPSRWCLVTKDVCSYGSYTDFFFLSDSLAFITARSLLLQIYTVSQMTPKELFSWAEIQFIVSQTLKGRLFLSNLPECSAWVLWWITSLIFHWYGWGRQVCDSLGKRNNTSRLPAQDLFHVIMNLWHHPYSDISSWEGRTKLVPFPF